MLTVMPYGMREQRYFEFIVRALEARSADEGENLEGENRIVEEDFRTFLGLILKYGEMPKHAIFPALELALAYQMEYLLHEQKSAG